MKRFGRGVPLTGILLCLAIQLVGAWAFAEVWSVKDHWDKSWERKFSLWVEKSVDLSIATRPRDLYYEQFLDCADLIYYLRAIFSFENRLDFAAKGMDGVEYTHASPQFDAEPNQKKRFKKFLARVLWVTNTATLQRDSVQVPVSREGIQIGTILLTDRNKNHAWVVKNVKTSGVLELISATETVPPSSLVYPSMSFPFAASAFDRRVGFLRTSHGGFRRWLWPSEQRARNRVLQSDEQSRIPIANYFETIQSRLALEPESSSDLIDRKLDELCMQMRIRTNLITDAVIYQTMHRNWERSQIDSLSTLNRDRRIRDQYFEIVEYFNNHRATMRSDTVQKFQLFTAFSNESWDHTDVEKRCLVQWAQNRIEPLADLLKRLNQMSANPADSLAKRWGSI